MEIDTPRNDNSLYSSNDYESSEKFGESLDDEIVKEVGFFPELCFPMDSVPELYPCINNNESDSDEKQTTATTTTLSTTTEVTNTENVVIKKEKVQEEEPHAPIHETQEEAEENAMDEEHTDIAPTHCAEYHRAVLRKTIATILGKSGFSGASSTYVMEVFTDIVDGYFMRLGKMLRTHVDDYGAFIPFEEVFSRVLCEMGVSGIQLADFSII